MRLIVLMRPALTTTTDPCFVLILLTYVCHRLMDVIGLWNGRDFDRLEHCPRATQERFFELQFTLAEQTGLPMFLHSRATGGAMVEMLTANRHRFKAGVVHSFDGEADEAAALVALDLYIGAL